MRDVAPAHPDSLTKELMAPCGMDCGLCIGHLRDRKTCPGCNDPDDASKAHHCAACVIKRCEHLPRGPEAFCVDCAKYPCARLRQLDKRYRSKYRMSMLENLNELRRVGVTAFADLERTRWACPHCGALVSVHRTACLACGKSVEGTRGAGLTSAST
jgi:hypothetical protein